MKPGRESRPRGETEGALTARRYAGIPQRMNDLPEDDGVFLAGLVKTARQKPHRVDWTDRDGSVRTTVLSAHEATRLNELAHAAKVSKAELLRRAAHVPVKR